MRLTLALPMEERSKKLRRYSKLSQGMNRKSIFLSNAFFSTAMSSFSTPLEILDALVGLTTSSLILASICFFSSIVSSVRDMADENRTLGGVRRDNTTSCGASTKWCVMLQA